MTGFICVCGCYVLVSVAGVAAAGVEPPASARASSRMRKNRQVNGAPGMRIGTRRGDGGGQKRSRPRTSPAAQQLRLASRAAFRSIRFKLRTQPTAARRTSMDRRPQVKAARIADPLRVDLTEHATDR
ncbi:hypothetical protein EVAR_91689_1 [Eumeta japonica]|uniref:Secreted protein n=1 Tax=Eumeta variegata TaxID=151549 RepID=A0A4C1ZIB2_EUMVA|nr:hypothetical protein EVAR_91689_1 [Eumeta japonica]